MCTIKINTYEANQENPWLSSYGFCLKNDIEDQIYTNARYMGEASSLHQFIKP